MAKQKKVVTATRTCEFWKLVQGEQYFVNRTRFYNGEHVYDLTRCSDLTPRVLPTIFFNE